MVQYETKKYMTSGAFARLCKTTKETLRHYRDIGLLEPAYEGKNGYLYYVSEQFHDYYLIHILKKTGTSLADIKAYMDHPAPEAALDLLREQQKYLQKERQEIEQMEQVVANSIANIELGLARRFPPDTPRVEYFEEEHLIAIPVKEFEQSTEDEDTVFISFLHKYVSICRKNSLITDYQTGGILDAEDFLKRKITVSHIYTKVDKALDNPYYMNKPAGYYLTVLDKGHWDTAKSVTNVSDYMKKHSMQVKGKVFVYDLSGYLLNGIEANTMSLIMIPVNV